MLKRCPELMFEPELEASSNLFVRHGLTFAVLSQLQTEEQYPQKPIDSIDSADKQYSEQLEQRGI